MSQGSLAAPHQKMAKIGKKGQACLRSGGSLSIFRSQRLLNFAMALALGLIFMPQDVVAKSAATAKGQAKQAKDAEPVVVEPAAQSSEPLPVVSEAYVNLPMHFEFNQGQAEAPVLFSARGMGYSVFLTQDNVVLALDKNKRGRAHGAQDVSPDVLTLEFVGASVPTRRVGTDLLPGRVNYFRGSDPSSWQSAIPAFERVLYEEVYSGINVEFYGNQRRLEYDFVVEPGADPSQIRMRFGGEQQLKIDAEGNLVVFMRGGKLLLHTPTIYQEIDDERVRIDGNYTLLARDLVGIAVESYDPDKVLVIDPILSYATYFGGADGNGVDFGYAIAVDDEGSAYITGRTSSVDFPTEGAQQENFAGGEDAFVLKLNPEGSLPVYSTYLGGSAFDTSLAIAVDEAGRAYLAGHTASPDFPTLNPLQAGLADAFGDAFVAKLNADGTLAYSTYYGAEAMDEATAIALDAEGHAYVGGNTESSGLLLVNPVQASYGGMRDAFLLKLSPSGAPLFATYHGGTSQDQVFDVSVMDPNRVALVGMTESADLAQLFPLQPHRGASDAFVTVLSTTGGGLAFSSFLGGTHEDQARGVAHDSGGNLYIAGHSNSADLPLAGSAPRSSMGGTESFAAKLHSDYSAYAYLTYLGGSRNDFASGIAVDSNGFATVSGHTNSADFPVEAALQETFSGIADAYATQLDAQGASYRFSTYLGGSGNDQALDLAADRFGGIYVTGFTTSANFPVRNAVQSSLAGVSDAFIAKIDIAEADLALSATASSERAVSGSTLDVALRVQNNGPHAVRSAEVFLDSVSGLELVALTGPLGACLNFEEVVNLLCSDLLDNGSLFEAQLVFEVTAAEGETVDLAVSAGSATEDPELSNNAASIALPVNRSPSAAEDSFVVQEDSGENVLDVLANDSDPDGDALTLAFVGNAAHGTLSLSEHSVTYTPEPDFHGEDTFVYSARDAYGSLAEATVHVTVASVNDAPRAADDAVETDEEVAVLIDVLANDGDPDGDTLVLLHAGAAQHGEVEITAGLIRYTPELDFYGTDSFTYTISDGNGGEASAAVIVTVHDVNEVPVAADDSAEARAGDLIAIPVLANDSDPDGGTLSILSVGSTPNATVVIDGSVLRYVADREFAGTDRFSYQISDGQGGTAEAFVTVEVAPHNQPPVAHAGMDQRVLAAGIHGALVVLDGSGSSDPDGDALTYTWTGPFAEGGTAYGVSPQVTLPFGLSAITLTVNDGEFDSDPDQVEIMVYVGVRGLSQPLAALSELGQSVHFPRKTFRTGSNLPLKLDLFASEGQVGGNVAPPRLVEVAGAEGPVALEQLSSPSNADLQAFRYADGHWHFNMKTRGLEAGSYVMVIEMPDGLQYVSGFRIDGKMRKLQARNLKAFESGASWNFVSWNQPQ